MTFTPFQNLLPRTATKFKIAKEFKAIAVCRAFESLIPDLFPERKEALAQIRAKFYKQHILTIGVDSSQWASEIMMRKPRIIDDINKKCGETFNTKAGKITVKDIKTLVG
jgi:hypothetical protein